MSESICEAAIDIIHRTNDGNDLAPEHLKLVENAVNGFLNEAGEAEFYRLHGMVKVGYKKPWLQGVEHFTINHAGYVYWKGNQVEHFTLEYAYSSKAKTYLVELGKRCEFLEAKGLPVNTSYAVWRWEEVLAKNK